MALINTAGILAGRGFRVLVIDLDLEAPGLSYLNPDAPADSLLESNSQRPPVQPGFVDLLNDARERGEEADMFQMSAQDLANRYTQPYHLPDELREFKDGSLHIMPAGRIDGGYAQRLDALKLHQLYEEGLGEPLIRAFKKKFAEADLYDYVLVDSRTGFSDEAGICTRDLADHLMILSGLNRQNVEGTCEFLKALRAETQGKPPTFQIILSPVPNGEDELLDKREKMAKKSFAEAWGSEVDLSLQIPYHPQLALTEEPHIFRRRRGYLFEAYRSIERHMLSALGHNPFTLMDTIEETLWCRDYEAALQVLRRFVRLDSGSGQLSSLASDLTTYGLLFRRGKPAGNLNPETPTLRHILSDEVGQRVVEFLVDHLPLDESGDETRAFLDALESSSPELADRLHQRMIEASPKDVDALGGYAVFLEHRRGDLEGAAEYFKRAIEADPKNAKNLANCGQFLVGLGRLSEAEPTLLSAFRQLDSSRRTMITSEVCYSLWLVSRMQGENSECWERGLKFLLQKSFRRPVWSFDRILEQAKDTLPPEEFEYAQSLARAILDEDKVADLEHYVRWRDLVAVDPKSVRD